MTHENVVPLELKVIDLKPKQKVLNLETNEDAETFVRHDAKRRKRGLSNYEIRDEMGEIPPEAFADFLHNFRQPPKRKRK